MGIRNKPGPTRNYEEVTKAMATATASGAAAKTQNYLHSTAATNVAAVLPCATYCCHLMAMARCRCFCPVTSNIQHPCQDRIPKYSSMSSCANMEAPGDVFTSLRIVVIVVSWPGFNWLWLPSILASTRCSVSARFSLPIGSPLPRTQMQTSIKLHYANIRSKVATKAHRAWEEVKDDKWEIGNGFGFGFGFGLGFGIGG